MHGPMYIKKKITIFLLFIAYQVRRLIAQTKSTWERNMFVCVCVCVCIYTYIYTHTHTHTHTHTYIRYRHHKVFVRWPEKKTTIFSFKRFITVHWWIITRHTNSWWIYRYVNLLYYKQRSLLHVSAIYCRHLWRIWHIAFCVINPSKNTFLNVVTIRGCL